MQVLILSCNTGEGHNSCAKAIKEVCDINGDVCKIEDAIRFISEEIYKVMSKGHDYIYRYFPKLFGKGYDLAEKHTGFFVEDSVMYNFFAKGADEIRRLVVEEGYDTVICTHPFAALMLTEARKRHNLTVPTGFVATDYTCSPSVKDGDLDFYFIPDERLVEDFLSEHITEEKLIPCGIPIRQMFYSSEDMVSAKEKFDVSPEHKHVVLMCGSMGCGPIRELAVLLADKLREDWELTIVCGTNNRLKTSLEEKNKDKENLHIKGFVDNMSLLLDSADLYLTKPGGISVSEAATKHLPMVFINAVAGCENYNSDFFTKVGVALKGDTTAELVKICTELLADENCRETLKNNYSSLRQINSAKYICDVFKEYHSNLSCAEK